MNMIRTMISTIIVSLLMATGALSAEFSADLLVESMGGTNSGKIYFKDYETSRTEMMGMVSILKRPRIYQLFTNTKKYVVKDINEIKKKNPAVDAASFKEWIKKNKIRKTGSEKVQGYRCDIYEGDVKVAQDMPPVHMKIWYTPKLGYPIRNESTLPSPAGKMSSRLENIKLAPQDSPLFEIPAGYTQAKDMQEAMGSGGIPSMGDRGQGQAPSQEQVQKMLEKMMKKMGKE